MKKRRENAVASKNSQASKNPRSNWYGYSLELCCRCGCRRLWSSSASVGGCWCAAHRFRM